MRNRPARAAFIAALLAALALLSGCAAMVVHPWDRDLLSEDRMKFVPSSIENAVDEHIYFSKEASVGGRGMGGGGCGCN
jgi:hypothetical protein